MTEIIEIELPDLILQAVETGVEIIDVAPVAVYVGAINAQQLADKFVFGETPSGLINGSNATFTTANQFIPESLTVEVNGITQKLVNDYAVTGGQTIFFLVSPEVGDLILVNYIKA